MRSAWTPHTAPGGRFNATACDPVRKLIRFKRQTALNGKPKGFETYLDRRHSLLRNHRPGFLSCGFGGGAFATFLRAALNASSDLSASSRRAV